MTVFGFSCFFRFYPGIVITAENSLALMPKKQRQTPAGKGQKRRIIDRWIYAPRNMALPAFAGRGRRCGHSFKNGEGPRINFRGAKIGGRFPARIQTAFTACLKLPIQKMSGQLCTSTQKTPEAYDVLEGENTLSGAATRRPLPEQATSCLYTKGTPHNYQSGPQGGKVPAISPAGQEGYFKQVADA